MAKHITTFLDNDYTDFAVYRIYQRLPHILDSLGQTQRKILYVMEDLPEVKKVKTAEIYSHVYSKTQYLHGDMSVYNVAENMARSCTNNFNLLTQEGSFGYRTDKSAASPRYTSTRFSKLARFIFRKEDKPIFFTQEFEGKSIEPKFLMPIVPVSLINGYSAIAVGFASKFMSRSPESVIDSSIQALQYKKRKNSNWEEYTPIKMNLAFPYYTGNIIHDVSHVNQSAWIMTGALKKTSRRNIVEITDLPPEGTRESYIKKLKRMLDKGTIKSYDEACAKNKFKFKVRVQPDLWKKSEDELLEILGLVDKVAENFTFLNPDGDAENTVIKFKSAEDYLKEFLTLRQLHYATRKAYQLDKIQQEILVLKERVRFINAVNAGDIIITKRKKVDLEKELKIKEYNLIDNNYDHLLGMRMYALTEENVQKFQKVILDKEKEFSILEKTSIEDLHINELKELKKIMQDEVKDKGLS